MLNRNAIVNQFQSTLPTWGATLLDTCLYFFTSVSIHAPHVGSDIFAVKKHVYTNVSIHAPHVGSDVLFNIGFLFNGSFNPRSPRGERLRVTYKQKPRHCCFNPRSPRGERRGCCRGYHLISNYVSIHAPHVGSDKIMLLVVLQLEMFQSTLPTWGAT